MNTETIGRKRELQDQVSGPNRLAEIDGFLNACSNLYDNMLLHAG